MENISDLTVYNDGMRKSLLDKIWFLSKLDSSVKGVYDYGCADGSLLEMVHTLFPNMSLCGYDFNPDMVNLAHKRLPHATISTKPLYELDGLVVNASSVFHEVHAYSDSPEQDYDNIFEHGAPYVAIRDMFYSEKSCHSTNPVFLASVYQKQPLEKIREFEAFQGPISENKNFLQFLLTYRYTENWDREVRENYFPHSLEEFLRKIPGEYQVVHIEHYTLPFLRDRIFEDFGFTLADATHAKILLKRA